MVNTIDIIVLILIAGLLYICIRNVLPGKKKGCSSCCVSCSSCSMCIHALKKTK